MHRGGHETVLVSAHTSAGKSAVAGNAIAKSLRCSDGGGGGGGDGAAAAATAEAEADASAASAMDTSGTSGTALGSLP